MPESHSMLFVTFDDPAAVRAAYDEVRELHGVRQAAVLERSAEGILDVPESWVHGAGTPTVVSGLLGGLVGLLGGPVGFFLGWTAGTVLGGATEFKRFQDAAEGLTVFSSGLAEGESMLILDLREESPDPVDAISERHGGRLVRRPAEAVEAEVRAAQQTAEDEVRKEQEEAEG
ncbi:histidine kinase [Kitasatospora sp. NBC_00240]|uniref:histidine kinase n=1 Tax=Kitasatospora sp. NBC_00240 TaxID=2903567 RepID=UPI002259B607|nr:histidine kinase [Kitasatospora sp. NBC_00240]MCX5215015.1 histidine kinase [Kitasatospora sp. NBC_00240]